MDRTLTKSNPPDAHKEPREFLSQLFRTAVRAADPLTEMKACLPPRPRGRTVVIGAGKAAAQMAAALESIWTGGVEGVVVTRYGFGCKTRFIEVLEASHPIPDQAGVEASYRLMNAVKDLTPDDLVIALISGGGSALLSAPPAGLTLKDDIEINSELLASGAPISAMNVVRKHLSAIKGSRLAAATRAKVVSLLVSDVPGDLPHLIASGPTIPDWSTPQDALNIVEQYRMKLPQAAMHFLRTLQAVAPLPDASVFSGHEHHIVASASMSLEAAADQARKAGIEAAILSDSMQGEARGVAQVHAAIAREIAMRNRPFSRPVVLLSGGETTVTLLGHGGKGGRNSEFALGFAIEIAGFESAGNIHLLAADTDGIDGHSDAAGAFVDGGTVTRIQAAGYDPRIMLDTNDSYTALAASGDLFVTGPTGTNVNDFRAILIT